jgi:hypothetical protein
VCKFFVIAIERVQIKSNIYRKERKREREKERKREREKERKREREKKNVSSGSTVCKKTRPQQSNSKALKNKIAAVQTKKTYCVK